MKKKDNKPTEANEPSAAYQKPSDEKTIRFFSSFEEMNEFDHRSYAALTPSEALSHVTLMRLTAHPYLNTNLNPWGNQIYFD